MSIKLILPIRGVDVATDAGPMLAIGAVTTTALIEHLNCSENLR
jgi:hypothetical protein